MHPFFAVWNHLKTSLFSNVFSGYRKGALGANGLLDTFLTTHRYADTKNTYNVYVITYTQRILYIYKMQEYQKDESVDTKNWWNIKTIKIKWN